MLRSTVAAIAVLALVGGACGPGGDTEVLGISVERDPTPSPASEEPSPDTGRTPAKAPREPEPATETPAAPEAPAEPQPEPTTPPPATTPPPSDPPPSEPEPEPEPEPYVLGDARSNGFSRWQPKTDDPDACCWIELDGAPPQDRDADHGDRAVVGRLVDPVPAGADGPEPWQRRVRDVTCQGALVAPSDRGMVARGTVEVVISYGPDTLVAASYHVDVTVPAGGRHELPRPGPGTVDADDGHTVSCDVRFVRS